MAFAKGSEVWRLQVAGGLISAASPAALPVLPLQALFLVWSAVVATVTYRLARRESARGELFAIFLVLHEGGKGLLESLRVPYAAHLQAASFLIFVAALIFLAVRQLQRAPRAVARSA